MFLSVYEKLPFILIFLFMVFNENSFIFRDLSFNDFIKIGFTKIRKEYRSIQDVNSMLFIYRNDVIEYIV